MNSTSQKKLATAHPDLQVLARKVSERFPIQVICGFRGKEEQDLAFKNKASKKQFPDSKHNQIPSLAIDCVPDPDRNPATLDWKDLKAFADMCEIFQEEADKLGIKIRLGKDFSFRDWPHIELA